MPTLEETSTITAQEIITIGSDPEFAFVSPTDKGRTLDACEVFSPKTEATSIDCEFGYDGHNATAEIRPKPQNNPKDAVKEIKALLERNKKLYPQAYKYNLMATNDRLSLGGHIHFGHPLLTQNNPEYVNLIKQITKNLDNLLAFPCIYLENKEDGKRRRQNFNYGHLSDWREQNWGFEYRTLSSFIASRELTNDIFYLGHAIADATINHNFKCKEVTTTEGFDYAFNAQSRDLLRPHLPAIFKQERALPKVKKEADYKKAVEDFIKLVEKEVPIFDTEIKKGWNIDFDISDFWKVDKIETLIEKIAKILITIHTTTHREQFKETIIKFVAGSYKDVSCPEIAKNVNIALNNLLPEEVLKSQAWKKIRVCGLKADKGNKIWLGYMYMRGKRKKQLLGMLWDIASNFQHTSKITEISSYKPEARANTIYFGRKIREENLLLPEAMTIVTILLLNKDLYKQTQKKGRKETKLYVTKNKVIQPFIKHIKKADKFIAKPPRITSKKILNIDLPFIFDLDQNYDTINKAFRSIDEQDRKDLTEIMAVTAKRFRKIFKNRKHCARKCEKTLNYGSTPIVKFCGKCIATFIRQLCIDNLVYISSSKWHNLFEGVSEARNCSNCENDKPADNFCSDCGYCWDCCDCDTCEVCGEHNDDCDCWTCQNCDNKFPEDDNEFCHDCERCGSCGCRCQDVEGETTPTPPSPTATPNNPITSTDNTNPNRPRTYTSHGVVGLDLTEPFTPEAQATQRENYWNSGGTTTTAQTATEAQMQATSRARARVTARPLTTESLLREFSHAIGREGSTPQQVFTPQEMETFGNAEVVVERRSR